MFRSQSLLQFRQASRNGDGTIAITRLMIRWRRRFLAGRIRRWDLRDSPSITFKTMPFKAICGSRPAHLPGQDIIQQNMLPTNYLFLNRAGVGPIDGPPGIDLHSKDLAFRLYTTTVPEPATCMLMAIGLVGVLAARRRRSA